MLHHTAHCKCCGRCIAYSNDGTFQPVPACKETGCSPCDAELLSDGGVLVLIHHTDDIGLVSHLSYPVFYHVDVHEYGGTFLQGFHACLYRIFVEMHKICHGKIPHCNHAALTYPVLNGPVSNYLLGKIAACHIDSLCLIGLSAEVGADVYKCGIHFCCELHKLFKCRRTCLFFAFSSHTFSDTPLE